jgi:hypothetical protein
MSPRGTPRKNSCLTNTLTTCLTSWLTTAKFLGDLRSLAPKRRRTARGWSTTREIQSRHSGSISSSAR